MEITDAVSSSRLLSRVTSPPTSDINRFPVEILSLIFASVRESRRVGSHRSSFPFNAASTCPFWMEILKSNPSNWQSIAIDVADDPTPFLDTFSLFNGGPIDVVIFSSLKKETTPAPSKNQDTQKSHETTRARIISHELEPFTTRCASITFELLYQSSLPSAANILGRHLPHLGKLHLKSTIYDLDDSSDSAINIDVEIPPPGPAVQMPFLKEISLTGHYFMELQQLGRNWRRKIGGELRLSLFIDQFMLQKEDIGTHFGSRSLPGFLTAIEDLDCVDLSLSNFAFNYHPKPGNKIYTCRVETLRFNNVSPDFLSAFFSSVNLNIDNLYLLEFSRCSIPSIAEPITVGSAYSILMLEDIPFQASPTPSPYHVSDNSLYNAIELFAFTHLFLTGCKGVGDNFFEWLCGEDDYLPARDLKALRIESCPGFTSGALRRFLEARDIMERPLIAVEVFGKGPMMSKADVAWFLDDDETSTHVTWNVEADPNMTQDFISDLRPPGSDRRHEDIMYSVV